MELSLEDVGRGLYALVSPHLDEDSLENIDAAVQGADWRNVVTGLRHAAGVLHVELPEELAS